MNINFVNLFNSYNQIKIPIIQRDYAQGRDSAKEIRKNFLNTIENHLSEIKKLHLDFVYGSVIEENNEKILVLLDGQQRITTLFLLFWYAAVKESRINDFRGKFCFKDDDTTKSKLRYEVRPSSEDFLDYLVSETIKLDDNIDPSKVIKDKNWFYLGWIHDPTVSGILNMLDEIHSTFKKREHLFDELLRNQEISFDFLELNSFGLTDDLYIKMNSRGKLLTLYENFKAKLEKIIKDKKEQEFFEIAEKFDGEYLDFFWNIAKEEANKSSSKKLYLLTDSYMYNFFYNMTLNLYALTDNNVLLEYTKYTKLGDFIKDNSLISFYEKVYKSGNNLGNLIKFVDKIITSQNNSQKDIIRIAIKDELTLWDRVRFYAYYLGVLFHNEDEHWNRVLRNLINNTRIDALSEYLSALKEIKALSENLRKHNIKILEFIRNTSKNGKGKFIGFFSENQRKEEKLKAELILTDTNWREEIIKAEKNWYLDGKIGFLIEFSYTKGTYNLDSFKKYRDKFIKVWDFAKENNNNQILLYQALLTKGDYLPKIGQNKTFCSFETGLRAKSESWHNVFENESKQYLKDLLDDINIDSDENIETQLKQIIKNPHILDWRKYFIENPDYIEYCNKLFLRFEGDKVYLLRHRQMNGQHVELHSWDLFNKCFWLKPENERKKKWKLEGKKPFEPFKYVEYVPSVSYDEPFICLKEDENSECVVKIEYSDNKFVIRKGETKREVECLDDLDKYCENIKNIVNN